MIIRHEMNGGLTMIPQTEHSQFVGQLAAHWGNEDVAPLEPYESVVRAATFHDYGYVQWEPDVQFDSASGEPLEFRKIGSVSMSGHFAPRVRKSSCCCRTMVTTPIEKWQHGSRGST